MSGKQTSLNLKISKKNESEEELKTLGKKRKFEYPRTLAEKEFKMTSSLVCRMMINDFGSFVDFRYLTASGAYSRKGLRMRMIDLKKVLPKIQEEMEEMSKLNLIK